MAYVDRYQQSREEEFLQKLTVAIGEKAQAVYTEAGGNLLTTNPSHMLVAYVGPRSADFRRAAEEMAALVLIVSENLTSASTEQEFDTAVNNVWEPFAKLAAARGLITVETAP